MSTGRIINRYWIVSLNCFRPYGALGREFQDLVQNVTGQHVKECVLVFVAKITFDVQNA